MKQILAVLLLTAMAAVGFLITKKLAAPEGPKQASPRAPSSAAGNTAGSSNPSGAKGKGAGRTPGQAATAEAPEVHIPESLKAQLDARARFDWRAAVDKDNVVSIADAWKLDLSAVDFDAPVLLYLDGEPVTRDAFRAYAVQGFAKSVFEARAARELALAFARSNGIDVALSDAEWAMVVDIKAKKAQVSRDVLVANWVLTSRLPIPAAEALQRWSHEGSLAYALSGDGLLDLPATFRANLPAGEPSRAVDTILARLHEAWAEVALARTEGRLPTESAMEMLVGANDGFAVFQINAWYEELAYRLWTPLDHEMPAGAAGMVALSSLPDEPVPAPWVWSAETAAIPTDEIFALFGPALSHEAMEGQLSDLLFFRTVARRLSDQGHLPKAEDAWANFEGEYSRSRGSAMPMTLVRCSIEGYPTLRLYRVMTRLIAGTTAMLPEGWDELDSLEPFFERNRFLIEHWQPQLRLALFPAYDLEQPLAVTDWNKSLASAQAMLTQVKAGAPFKDLQRAQMARLADAISKADGQQQSESFLRDYGEVSPLPSSQFDASLEDSIFRSLLRCTSLSASAVAHLEVGGVSEPWWTPRGYVLVQLEGVSVGRLENEVEDVLPTVLELRRNSNFQRFANAAMREVNLTFPPAAPR